MVRFLASVEAIASTSHAVCGFAKFGASEFKSITAGTFARVAGALLFALAAFVAITSLMSLLGYSELKPTVPGTAILVAAAVVMPWLAKEKRRLSGATGSSFEGGRRTVGTVCLPIVHRLGGTGDQRHLARQEGRPDCGFRDSAAHCLGGSGSHALEGLRLLLVSPASTQSVIISRATT